MVQLEQWVRANIILALMALMSQEGTGQGPVSSARRPGALVQPPQSISLSELVRRSGRNNLPEPMLRKPPHQHRQTTASRVTVNPEMSLHALDDHSRSPPHVPLNKFGCIPKNQQMAHQFQTWSWKLKLLKKTRFAFKKEKKKGFPSTKRENMYTNSPKHKKGKSQWGLKGDFNFGF